ncbi:MAG: hypothetical protein HQM10_11015 [Candidatus Riflebacteria bacterium]|nr:hypothetical protein [Candidatus Riflebacteria bacterium]
MYDETISRSARRSKIKPIEFVHPLRDEIISNFSSDNPVSVILTGTAGDGKTHLCRQVWQSLNGDDKEWAGDDPYLCLKIGQEENSILSFISDKPQKQMTVHFIRDLSGWSPQQGSEWEPEKENLLNQFSQSIFDSNSQEIFLIAANDGQLIDSWKRLKNTVWVVKARQAFEDLLVEDKKELPGTRLKFFNLSRGNSVDLFNETLNALLNHDGWKELEISNSGENEFFGINCPIRKNLELLKTELVQTRLRNLIQLCGCNGFHIPIRQILILLSNALLGHPDVKDYLMTPSDVPQVIANDTICKASLYNNIFGGNLPENRRSEITIFNYFDRFQIGNETANRIDNILIFGEDDPQLQEYFQKYVGSDRFYGVSKYYSNAKKQYIEGTDEDENKSSEFIEFLKSQRRGLFFKIPQDEEEELKIWELTVFKFAGEYLNSLIRPLKSNEPISKHILSKIIRGLNRIFTGMFINSDREIILATSGNNSQARICRMLISKLNVSHYKGEKIVFQLCENSNRVLLVFHFSQSDFVEFPLNLIRYEFLSRVGEEGALPGNFSRECYEDILSLKSQLLERFRKLNPIERSDKIIELTTFSLSDQGLPIEHSIEVTL